MTGPLPETPYPLGRERNHVASNRAFPLLVRMPRGFEMRPVKHRMYSKVLDQSPWGQCVAATGVDLVNAYPLHKLFTRHKTIKDSFRWYSWATNNDPFEGGMPEQDTGTDMNSVAKIMRAEKAITGWRWCFSWEQFQMALTDSPVAIGTDWDEPMFYPDADGFIVPNGDLAGGHQTSIYEYLGDDIYKGRNHWTSLWGLRGDYLIRGTHLRSLLYDRQGDVTVLYK